MIELNKLAFSYNKKTMVLNEISMIIEPGRIVGILGHNGAGKSTLFKLICGLLVPNYGSIQIGGMIPNVNKKCRGYLSYMPESDGIYESLTVEQNVEYRARLAKLPRGEIKSRCEEMLSVLGLLKIARKTTSTLSNGQRKRVSLACACIGDPKLLLLDEPTNGIDQESLANMYSLLNRLKQQGCTILISTHDFLTVEAICNQIIIINEGRVVHNDSDSPDFSSLKELYLSLTKEDNNYD